MTRWWLHCDTYVAGPFKSLDAAVRRLEQIEKLGACQDEHWIEEDK